MSKDITSENHSRNTQSFTPRDFDMEKVERVADEHFDSKADLYRTAVKNLLDEYSDDDLEADPDAELHKPDHEELRDAFEKLLEASDHPHGPRPITVEEAKSKLNTTECPKKQVKTRYLQPLAADGFISVTSGKVTVHRRTEEQVEKAEQEADEEIERLGLSGTKLPSQNATPEEQQTIRKYQTAGLDVPFRLAAWTASRTIWNNGGTKV